MVFYEIQRGSKLIIYAIIAFMIIIGTIVYIVAPDAAKITVALIMTMIVGLIATLLFGFSLETKIDGQNITLKIPMLLNKKITRTDIASTETFIYRPLIDFGGWGIRYAKGGIMYNAGGNRAVKFVLKNDEIIYLGTQKPEALIDALGK